MSTAYVQAFMLAAGDVIIDDGGDLHVTKIVRRDGYRLVSYKLRGAGRIKTMNLLDTDVLTKRVVV